MQTLLKMIFQLKKLTNKYHFYEFVIKNFPNSAIYIFFRDQKGEIIFMLAEGDIISQAGFDKNEIIGSSLDQVLEAEPDLLNFLRPAYERTLSGEHMIKIEHVYKQRQYSQTFRSFQTPYSRKNYGMLVSADITHTSSLEQSIEQIAWKNAHHVRGPLATILGLLSILEKDDLDANTLKIINMIEEKSKELDQVIHDIVSLTYDEEKEEEE